MENESNLRMQQFLNTYKSQFMNYDVDYFIKKFEAIPEALWTIGTVGQKDRHCAAGHCGLTDDDFNCTTSIIRDETKCQEVVALGKLLMPLSGSKKHYEAIYFINDMHEDSPIRYKYKQPTPKQRILAALYDIKKLDQGTSISTERRNEVQSELQRADTTKELSQIEIVSETSDTKKELAC